MKCSVCSLEIKSKYCPNCGQYHKSGEITSISILKDLFGGIFSLEKSFYNNVKLALLDPRKLVCNYWDGYRGYYFSPGRFLAIAALFFVVQLMVGSDFLGIVVFSKSSKQFTILLVNILFFSLTGWLTYFARKRSFNEHVILNIYVVSLWSFIFVPIAIILSLLNVSNYINNAFLFLYWLLIAIWNSRVFVMPQAKRVGYIILHLSPIVFILWLAYYYSTS